MATDSTDAHGPADARGPGSHTHGASSDADRTKLAIALALIVGFMALEVAAGIIAHSLALLSDAAHMLTDAAAIGLSIFAIHLARRPAEGSMTFGFRPIEILSAQVNGITLLVLAAVIVFEAIQRLITPPEVNGGLMLAVALAGIVVNLAAAWTLARANRQSLNVEGSFRHIVTDLYAFIGTAIAAALILLMGFERADPIASLIVAGLMFHSAYILLRASGRVFMEAAPEDVDPNRDRRGTARDSGGRGGPRPPRVGGVLGVPGSFSPCPGGAGGRLPSTPRDVG